MSKLYAIGEALIDFTAQERGCLNNVLNFRKNAGGAPANVAVCAAKLGAEAAVITQLGTDAFGEFLVETMQREGVDTNYVFRTDRANTALAFVSLDEKGERDFSFYRNPSADMLLSEEEIKKVDFQRGDILHFCSVDLCDAPVRGAHDAAIARARAAGAIISFDPNLRYSLWKNAKELIATVKRYLPFADIVKVSLEELYDITGCSLEEEGVKALFTGSVRLVIVTSGKKGATAYFGDEAVNSPADLSQKVKDTTGAGDSFIGTVLYQILQIGEIPAKREQIETILNYANFAAGIVVSREGAIPAMPTRKEVFGGK